MLNLRYFSLSPITTHPPPP
jgi:RNA recognition motif-containing protein